MAYKDATKYKNVNEVLYEFVTKVSELLDANVIGIYLFGSLAHDDFNPRRSDIDLSVIVKKPLSQKEGEHIKRLHLDLERKYPAWKERIECSYTPMDLLYNTMPPKEPRPYFGAGIFYVEAKYGNEWLINNYLLSHKSITLQGPDFRTLVNPITVEDVRQACIKDLFAEWEPKMKDSNWLHNSHHQSYLVLNLCRILYTVLQNGVGSKSTSASWVKDTYPKWKDLIEEAERWRYGDEMKRQKEAIEFIKFTCEEIKRI